MSNPKTEVKLPVQEVYPENKVLIVSRAQYRICRKHAKEPRNQIFGLNEEGRVVWCGFTVIPAPTKLPGVSDEDGV